MVLVDFLEASCRRRPQARRAVLQVEVARLLLVEEEAEQAPEQEHDQERGFLVDFGGFWLFFGGFVKSASTDRF